MPRSKETQEQLRNSHWHPSVCKDIGLVTVIKTHPLHHQELLGNSVCLHVNWLEDILRMKSGRPQGHVPWLWCHLSTGGAPEAIYIFKPRVASSGRHYGPRRRRLLGGWAGPPFQSSLLWWLWWDTEAWGHVFWRLREQSNCAVCARKAGRVGRGARHGVIFTGGSWIN